MIWKLVMKYLKETRRSKSAMVIVIGTPIIFFTFFGFVFAPDVGTPSLFVGVMNLDTGYNGDYLSLIPERYEVSNKPDNLGSLLVNLLRDTPELLIEGIENENIGITLTIFENRSLLEKNLENQGINLGVIIPENFTEILLAIYNTQYRNENGVFLDLPRVEGNTSVTLLGDPSVSEYQSSSAMFQEAITRYTRDFYGEQVFTDLEFHGGYFTIETIEIGYDVTPYHEFAAGFIVFVVIMNMAVSAAFLAGEKESGTINRMKMSLMPTYKLFIAVAITQLILGTIQIAISIIFISLNGVNLSFSAWLSVYFILQVTNINITGLGMIAASFAKTKQDATTVTSILSAPLGFLSGAFLPVPEVWIVKSLNIQFWDIVPSYHSVQSLMGIFLEGKGLGDLIEPITLLIVFSFLWFSIGLLLYNRRVIQSDS